MPTPYLDFEIEIGPGDGRTGDVCAWTNLMFAYRKAPRASAAGVLPQRLSIALRTVCNSGRVRILRGELRV